jgi:hypothetical protein
MGWSEVLGMWIQKGERDRANRGGALRIALLLVTATWISACNEIDTTRSEVALPDEPTPELVDLADSGDAGAQLAVGIFYRDSANQSAYSTLPKS